MKRSTGKQKPLSAFMAWYTTLLCIVPPYKGWGWQTSAACVASGAPWFSSASRRPAGPLRKKDLIPAAIDLFYHREHRGHGGGTIITMHCGGPHGCSAMPGLFLTLCSSVSSVVSLVYPV